MYLTLMIFQALITAAPRWSMVEDIRRVFERIAIAQIGLRNAFYRPSTAWSRQPAANRICALVFRGKSRSSVI
jgi:hypothetical protein